LERGITPLFPHPIIPFCLTMAERAQVTSVEAVESFRASLIVFLKNARAVLEEASDEVLRLRSWVQDDRRRHWEHETRVRERKLEEAQAELFRARLSQFQESAALQLMTAQRAERAVREAEAKLAVVKKWDRELENRTDPLLKQVNQLHGFLTADMARALAYLDQVLGTLAAYASVAPPALAASGDKPGAGEGKPL
jgi:cell division septum initiation protein DivIVA